MRVDDPVMGEDAMCIEKHWDTCIIEPGANTQNRTDKINNPTPPVPV
jgi:hypothetical protein